MNTHRRQIRVQHPDQAQAINLQGQDQAIYRPPSGPPGQHPSNLAHHFATPKQQYDSAKVGMWIFLATEILMFGGLFVAYSVWRANYPEVFLFAHTKLKWELGAINTVFLIASSFTMAWAVRAAQLNQRRLLLMLLSFTLAGGFAFLVVKSIEYSDKYQHGLFVGPLNQYHPQYSGPAHNQDSHASASESTPPTSPGISPGTAPGTAPKTALGTLPGTSAAEPRPEQSLIPHAPSGPAGVSSHFLRDAQADRPSKIARHSLTFEQLPDLAKQHVHQFFQLYFLMTGLHTLHVIVGIGLVSWVFFRSVGGAFSSDYFTPVDMVGLYWHLIDLIWIFLFPLLYLIH